MTQFRSHIACLLGAVALLAPLTLLASDKPATPSWTDALKARLSAIDRAHAGELGVYVQNLDTSESVSLRADETWYFASGVKVPVAIQVMRSIDRGAIRLDSEVKLQSSDYVDGAGQTNWSPPGSALSVRYLLEQMLIHSDNTATDMLIGLVGLDEVNALVQELVPTGFGEITTLKDVRRHAYSQFHPRAFDISGNDFFDLKKAGGDQERIKRLAAILGVAVAEFAAADVAAAFEGYYATGLNSGQLSAYGALLEQLVRGAGLEPDSAAYLMDVMARVETGKRRIRAGLTPAAHFVHKTGTQYRRTCDFGIVEARLIVAACVRGEGSRAQAESALRSVGAAVAELGLSQPRNEIIAP